MTQSKLVLLTIACGLLFTGRPASGQGVPQGLVASMLDCTMHAEDGPWAPRYLRQDGLLRFTYLYDPPKKSPGEYDYHDQRVRLYVAFWNGARTRGEFLDFSLDRSGTRRWLTISNDGQIYYTKGKLDLDFFQGGEWTRTHYMIRLAKLRADPVETVSVRDIKRTSTLCDSIAHPHLEWGTNPPAKK
jgi:hypothetical protein